jgi:hypothetical protein
MARSEDIVIMRTTLAILVVGQLALANKRRDPPVGAKLSLASVQQ